MFATARAYLVRCAAVVLVGATLAVASASIAPQQAEAQAVSAVQSLPKGTIGLGLMGVELGLIVPAMFGARDWWPYLVFPVLGGAGGAVGGYFLDINTQNQPEISVSMLAIGVALLVPAIIGTLALTAYSPPTESNQADEDMQYDEPTGDSVEAVQEDSSAAPAESESSPQSRLEQRVRALYAGGPGLIRFHRGAVLLGAPLVASLPRFTGEELERLHVQQGSDVIVPVVSASF
ncbi:MAG: hypothetical protein K1X94_20820 [Sandaracinaceae bacterium]|nr:hypothetical protein [Sandaracinaceae bacterium]